jgi:2-hydroxy-3-keto-5-methylthiopentenyl-1-phosphate phosphatase
VSSSRVKCHVLIDFDGTISAADTTDVLFERFALPEWVTIEEQWKAGEIGSRECMLRQVDLLRTTPEIMDAFIADIKIDPDVPAFVELCQMRGFEVTVVSDGLDRVIEGVLRRHSIDLPYRANAMTHLGADRWRLSFPNAKTDCRALSGNCKCGTPDTQPAEFRIVVGDGRSDFCVAEQADFVLAKSALIHHAKAKQLPHATFKTFAEAGRHMVTWLDQGGRDAVHAARQANADMTRRQ